MTPEHNYLVNCITTLRVGLSMETPEIDYYDAWSIAELQDEYRWLCNKRTAIRIDVV